MKRKLVIFGLGDFSELANYYFSTESDYKVSGFSVDSAYIQGDTFCDLPVVPFESVGNIYSPETHDFFVATGYSKLNLFRKEKFLACKALGYQLATFVSSRSTFLTEVPIGENSFIFEDNTVQPFVTIGNNVTLWSGNHIGHHSQIHDHVFIASHAVVSGRVHIGEQCFVGVNATIRDGVTIGDRCVIGAGALILSDADAEGVYLGDSSKRSKVPSSRLRGL